MGPFRAPAADGIRIVRGPSGRGDVGGTVGAGSMLFAFFLGRDVDRIEDRVFGPSVSESVVGFRMLDVRDRDRGSLDGRERFLEARRGVAGALSGLGTYED
jgi:hypothetical protein